MVKGGRASLKSINWATVVEHLVRATPTAGTLYDAFRTITTTKDELNSRVALAAAALSNASSVLADLQTTLSTQIRDVSFLQEEYKRYQALAAVEEGKARAVLAEVRSVVDEGKGRERWIALAINLVAGLVLFVLGVWLSPVVRKLLGVGL